MGAPVEEDEDKEGDEEGDEDSDLHPITTIDTLLIMAGSSLTASDPPVATLYLIVTQLLREEVELAGVRYLLIA